MKRTTFIRKSAIEWVAELSPNPIASMLWNDLPEDIRTDKDERPLSVFFLHAEINTASPIWSVLRASTGLTERLYWERMNERPEKLLTPEKFIHNFENGIW